VTDQPTNPTAGDPDEIRCALPTFMTCGCNHLTGCQHPAPAPACGEECAEGHAYAGRCTQADPLPISTCPRTDRHGYHMWPDQPGPAFCPGHPAPATVCRSGKHPDHPAETCRDVETTDETTARTTPDNPVTSNNTADNPPVPPELKAIVDKAAGKDHSGTGAVMRCLADVLAAHKRMLADETDTARTTADNPAASNNEAPVICELPHQTIGEEDDCHRRRDAASDDGLHAQYEATLIRAGFGEQDATDATDAVMAVRDRRIEQLAAELAAMHTRAVLAEDDTNHNADLFHDARRRAATAEATVTRVRNLAEQWTTAGPPPLGTLISRWWDRRLAELWATTTDPAIGKAVGRDIDDGRHELHYQRVDVAEAKLAAVRAALAGLKADAERYRQSGSDALLNTAAGYSGAVARIEAALDGPAETTPPAELADLRAWLVTEATTCRRNAAAARHHETRQALDGMAAGHDVAVRVIDGMAAGKGLPVSGGVVAGDATVAGEQEAGR
jgi:hypothetical protein